MPNLQLQLFFCVSTLYHVVVIRFWCTVFSSSGVPTGCKNTGWLMVRGTIRAGAAATCILCELPNHKTERKFGQKCFVRFSLRLSNQQLESVRLNTLLTMRLWTMRACQRTVSSFYGVIFTLCVCLDKNFIQAHTDISIFVHKPYLCWRKLVSRLANTQLCSWRQWRPDCNLLHCIFVFEYSISEWNCTSRCKAKGKVSTCMPSWRQI